MLTCPCLGPRPEPLRLPTSTRGRLARVPVAHWQAERRRWLHPHLHALHVDAGTHELPPDEVSSALPTGDGVHDFGLQAVILLSHLHFSPTGRREVRKKRQEFLVPPTGAPWEGTNSGPGS